MSDPMGKGSLEALGWDEGFARAFSPYRDHGLAPARVAVQEKDLVACLTGGGEVLAEVSGRFRHQAVRACDFPAVGDWVALQANPAGAGRSVIHAVLPRRGAFFRKAAGQRTEEQVVAANVDTAFLVSGLDGGRGLSLRRIERYVTLTYESGAAPVVVLNKADLCGDVDSAVAAAESAAPGAPVLAVCAAEPGGADELRPHLGAGRTAAFLGSSGVGKSTLINALLGWDRQDVSAVRERDRRGRHTTTRRELIPLPGDLGLLVDTPGMRELGLWTEGSGEGLDESFEDVEDIASQCRFRDCTHQAEPGCAVHLALGDGTLDPARYESYLELRKELAYVEGRKAYLDAKRDRFKKISKWSRKLKKRDV